MDSLPIIDDIIVHKPKKSIGNSYICPIYYQSKKKAYTIILKNAKVLKVSRLNNLDDIYLFLRIPNVYNYFFDVNQKIIDIVKKCSGEWFNNNMNPELIEDYYINTLVYDKTYGEVLKLKVLDSDDHSLEKLGGKDINYDIDISLTNLRFFKQKFVLEMRVNNFSVNTGFSFIDSDQEDRDIDNADSISDVAASPSHEEVLEIREDFLKSMDIKIDEIKDKITDLSEKIKDLESCKNEVENLIQNKEKLKNLQDDFEILKYCQDESI